MTQIALGFVVVSATAAAGRAFSSRHVISHAFEYWFDKPALEKWYEDHGIPAQP